jgi:hypothetical protein
VTSSKAATHTSNTLNNASTHQTSNQHSDTQQDEQCNTDAIETVTETASRHRANTFETSVPSRIFKNRAPIGPCTKSQCQENGNTSAVQKGFPVTLIEIFNYPNHIKLDKQNAHKPQKECQNARSFLRQRKVLNSRTTNYPQPGPSSEFLNLWLSSTVTLYEECCRVGSLGGRGNGDSGNNGNTVRVTLAIVVTVLTVTTAAQCQW